MLAPRLAAAIGAALISLMPLDARAGMSAADAVAAACPRLPDVAWWDTTPQKIVEYVDQTFQGDWETRLARPAPGQSTPANFQAQSWRARDGATVYRAFAFGRLAWKSGDTALKTSLVGSKSSSP